MEPCFNTVTAIQDQEYVRLKEIAAVVANCYNLVCDWRMSKVD